MKISLPAVDSWRAFDWRKIRMLRREKPVCGEREISHAYIIGHVISEGNGAMKGNT
jgi:hypothetical protein